MRPHVRRFTTLALPFIVALSVTQADAAAAQPSDTARVGRGPLFTSNDAILAGAFALGTVALFPLDKQLARQFQDTNAQSIRFAHHISTDLRIIGDPGSLIIGT